MWNESLASIRAEIWEWVLVIEEINFIYIFQNLELINKVIFNVKVYWTGIAN